MSLAFNEALDFVLKWEGGYVDDPGDPGGETIYGISRRAHPEAWKNGPPSKEHAARIYREEYWQRVVTPDMSPEEALAVFDAAVNLGASRAKRFWRDTGNFRDFTAKRLNYYTKLTSMFPKFGRGWVNRVADLIDTASDMKARWKWKRLYVCPWRGFCIPVRYSARSVVGDKLYVRIFGGSARTR